MNYKRNIKAVLIYIFSVVFSALIIISINALIFPKEILADEQNLNNYKEAQEYLENVQQEYNSIMEKVKETYNEVEQVTDQILQIQASYNEKQNSFNNMIKFQYVNATQYSLTSALLDSSSMQDFFYTLNCANSIIDYEYIKAKEKKDEKEKFDEVLNELNDKVAMQNQYLNQAHDKVNQANNTVTSLRNKLTPNEVADLERQAKGISEDESVPVQPSVDPQDDPYVPGPDPQPQPQPDPGPSPVSWSSGIASAYGGSSDPSTGPYAITATGEVCDDNSTGVAVPMS